MLICRFERWDASFFQGADMFERSMKDLAEHEIRRMDHHLTRTWHKQGLFHFMLLPSCILYLSPCLCLVCSKSDFKNLSCFDLCYILLHLSRLVLTCATFALEPCI